MLNIYLGNDTVIELSDVKNTTTQVIDTGAAVAVTLEDMQGDEVTGQTWPLAMPHVAAGLYRATISASIGIEANAQYRAIVTATGTDNEVGLWEYGVIAQIRSGEC